MFFKGEMSIYERIFFPESYIPVRFLPSKTENSPLNKKILVNISVLEPPTGSHHTAEVNDQMNGGFISSISDYFGLKEISISEFVF